MLQPGTNDPARIPGYTVAELVAELRRIAHNTRVMDCGKYTAGLLDAAADQIEGRR